MLSNSGPSATAAVRVTGRSWCLYTTSVVRVLEWPTASAFCTMGTPESDRSETKVWRSSRGVQSRPRPAFSVIA